MCAYLCSVLLAMPSGGCGAEERQSAVERFEKDGVEVIVSNRPRWAAGRGWKLTPDPEVVIGEEEAGDPRSLFSTVRGPVRLPDGDIVAGDSQTRELRYFDASGALVRAVGGRGQGPGEFNHLVEVHECGPGTIYAVDGQGRDEANVFDASGEFLGRYSFATNAGIRLYPTLTCNGKGQLLGMDWGDALGPDRAREEGYYRSTVHMWLLDPEGFVLRDFGEFPGVDRIRYISPQGSRGDGPHPFGKTPARTLGDDRAYIGTAEEFEIQVWSLEGELVRRLRRPVEDLTITDADVERYLELASPDAGTGEWARFFQIVADTVPAELATFPAYTRFLLDSEDDLWVENYRRPWDERRFWSVFDPEGVWLGDVEVPSTFEITEIGADDVLGIFRDELDQQSVRLYGLLKGDT